MKRPLFSVLWCVPCFQRTLLFRTYPFRKSYFFNGKEGTKAVKLTNIGRKKTIAVYSYTVTEPTIIPSSITKEN
ncbi:MAG: hypothetical protein AB2693_32440, partial [Candidatus Thiodiazotropha sp.]